MFAKFFFFCTTLHRHAPASKLIFEQCSLIQFEPHKRSLSHFTFMYCSLSSNKLAFGFQFRLIQFWRFPRWTAEHINRTIFAETIFWRVSILKFRAYFQWVGFLQSFHGYFVHQSIVHGDRVSEWEKTFNRSRDHFDALFVRGTTSQIKWRKLLYHLSVIQQTNHQQTSSHCFPFLAPKLFILEEWSAIFEHIQIFTCTTTWNVHKWCANEQNEHLAKAKACHFDKAITAAST